MVRRPADEEVDIDHLVDLVLRRCEGCALDYHVAIAQRFLAQQGFPPSVIGQVTVGLQQRLQPTRQRSRSGVVQSCNGSVQCDTCSRPLREHPEDPDNPSLIVSCSGRRVRLCL